MAEPQRGTQDYLWNLEPRFKGNLQRFLADNPYGATLLSGYRSESHQQDLFDRAVRRHGEANAPKWAARPGRSNHNHGLAGDIHFLNDKAKEWAHRNAHRYGLVFPMAHEPWHVEPIGLRNGTYEGGHRPDYDSYTVPPPGIGHAMDAVDDVLQGPFAAVNSILLGPMPHLDDDIEPALVADPAGVSTAIATPGIEEEVNDGADTDLA